MKNINIYMIIGISLMIFSCQTETDFLNKENNKPLLKYNKLFKSHKPDGSIVLQSNGSGTGNSITRRVTLSQKGGNNKKSLVIFNDKKSQIDFENHKHDVNLKNLFGKNIYYNIDGMSDQRNPSDSLYIPQEISVSFSANELSAGTSVNWNADNLNTNGVVINVVYDPLLQQNASIAWENQFRIKESFAVAEGNGTYQITQQDIDRFPQDAYITIKVSRGAFIINEDEPTLMAATSIRNEIKINKE